MNAVFVVRRALARGRVPYDDLTAYPDQSMARTHVDMTRKRQDAYRAARPGKRKAALAEWQELDPLARAGRGPLDHVIYGVVGVRLCLHVDQYMEEREAYKL